MTPAEILRAARARIDTPEKWGGGATPGSGPCVCQALWHTLDGNTAPGEALAVAALLSGAGLVPDKFAPTDVLACRWPLYSWNDAPERTHADVLAAFDKAIAEAERA